MKRKTNKNWPDIYLDEHLGYLRSSFSPMRVIEISKSKYSGLDERDYVSKDLYRKNGIFVTSDKEYVKEVGSQKHTKHSGIIFMPNTLTDDQKTYFADTMAGFIMEGTRNDKFMCRSAVYYPGYDGPMMRTKGKDTLLISWDELDFIHEEIDFSSGN